MIDTEGSTSPSSRRAWIEIALCVAARHVRESPSSRRAWIEIAQPKFAYSGDMVALLAEGVDRNALRCHNLCQSAKVALLAEGVDRNNHC